MTGTEGPRVQEPSAVTAELSSVDEDREKHWYGEERSSEEASSINIRFDSNGLPLVPQPSNFKDDPLNWPLWLKWAVLVQVGFMAFLGPYNAALINPSLVLLSKAITVDPKAAAYTTTTAIILGGVSPFFWTPLTNFYGRRPITLIASLLTVLGGVGSGISPTFAALIGTRALCGFGFGGLMSVGTACVNDMFYSHERGEKTGVYSIFVTNGAHIAALVGGYLGQSSGWRWDYYLGAISTALSLGVAIFLFPETLFSRDPDFLANRTHERTYMEMLWDFKGNMIPGRRLHASSFLHSVTLLTYPSVLIPFIYYTFSWALINVLPAISISYLYTLQYNLSSGTIGACLGISLTIGSLLGELFAGRASDILISHLACRPSHHGIRKPEYRLYMSFLSVFFMPTGLIIFGATLEQNSFYIPLIGLGIGAFGLQIASTCMYAYISDCYRELSAESGVVMNLGRGLTFVVGFFWGPFSDKVGFPGAWGTYAGVLVAAFLPVAALMVWGETWREKRGVPSWSRDY